MFDVKEARKVAREQYVEATGNEPTQQELNYMTACAEGTMCLYNTEKYGCLAEYLKAADKFITAELKETANRIDDGGLLTIYSLRA